MKTQTCDEHANRVAGCLECRRRARNYMKMRDWKRMHNVPTSAAANTVTSMLRELRAYGYDLQELAERTGLRDKHLWELCEARVTFVQLRTYHAVERVYRELRCFPGPSRRAANIAKRKGWAPPPPLPMPSDYEDPGQGRISTIVDEVVVDRLIAGEPVKANKYERIEAVRRLLAKGLLPGTVADRLGISGVRMREILAKLDGEKASA